MTTYEFEKHMREKMGKGEKLMLKEPVRITYQSLEGFDIGGPILVDVPVFIKSVSRSSRGGVYIQTTVDELRPKDLTEDERRKVYIQLRYTRREYFSVAISRSKKGEKGFQLELSIEVDDENEPFTILLSRDELNELAQAIIYKLNSTNQLSGT